MSRPPLPALFSLLLALAWLALAQAVHGSEPTWGTLDPTFAPPQGYATYFLGSGKRDRGIEAVPTPDGRIVVAGYTHNGTDYDLLLMRLTGEGALDPGLAGGKGYVIYGGAGDQMAFGLALQDDGKMVVTGRTSSGGNNQVLTLRFNSDGSLDTSFGQGGAAIYDGQGGGTDTGRAVILQPDGKILVAGELSSGQEKNAMVLRYLGDGTLDPSFGQGGVATYQGPAKADDWAFDLVLLADGGILVAGGVTTGKSEDIMLWRLTADGATDQGFGSGGMVSWAGPGGQADYGNAMALDGQGRILVAGADTDGQSYNIVLLAFLADGRLDPDFGQGGVATYQGDTGGYDYAWGLVVCDDGRILVAGTTTTAAGERPLVLSYLPQGTLDPSFAQGGVFKLEAGGASGRAYDLALMADGGVLVAGYLSQGGRDKVLLMRLSGQ